MIESIVLVEGAGVDENELAGGSLLNAQQLLVGTAPGGSIILHVAASTPADLGVALLDFVEISGVTAVTPLTLSNQ